MLFLFIYRTLWEEEVLLLLVPNHFSVVIVLFPQIKSYSLWAKLMRNIPVIAVDYFSNLLSKFQSQCDEFSADVSDCEENFRNILLLIESYVVVFHTNKQLFIGIPKIDHCLQLLLLSDLLICGEVVPTLAPFIIRPIEFIVLATGTLYNNVLERLVQILVRDEDTEVVTVNCLSVVARVILANLKLLTDICCEEFLIVIIGKMVNLFQYLDYGSATLYRRRLWYYNIIYY